MPRLRAVFLDVDDTLYPTTEFARKARLNALRNMRRLGIRLPLARLVRELDQVVQEFSSNDGEHFNKLLRRIPPEAKSGVNPAILIAAGVIAYHETKRALLRPFPDAVALLRRLKRAKVIRGVISSGLWVKQAEKLLRLGVYRYFTPEAIFISEQVGINKPNPELFRHSCRACGIDPREGVYIGNSMGNDILPAREAGMTTILVRRKGVPEKNPAPGRPDLIVQRLTEIPRFLAERFGCRV